MSNESAASETAPLRPPENLNSVNVSASLLLAKSRDVEKQYRNLNHNCNQNSSSICSCNNVIGNSTTYSNGSGDGNDNTSGNTSNATVSTTATVAFANLNNNNIEVRLVEDTTEEPSSYEHVSKINKMDHNRRMLYRLALDILILACVGFPILGFYLWGSAYQRGFFCDDESLKHPFKESTVRNWMLYIIGLVLPIGVILAVEIVRAEHSKPSTDDISIRHLIFMNYEVPSWMIECYKKIGIFGFGAAICQLTTDIAKYSIGRLRPHFFAVCQPIMADGTTCDDASNVGKYIEDFTCKGDDSTKRMLKEVHLSFPSGHSSFTFYTMVYAALYLQSRMNWNGSKLLRHFLQFLFIMIAWYTALSRVSDYKHHWSDVLAGSTIGAFTAVIVAKYVSDLFQRKSPQQYVLPCTNQEAQPQTIASNGH